MSRCNTRLQRRRVTPTSCSDAATNSREIKQRQKKCLKRLSKTIQRTTTCRKQKNTGADCRKLPIRLRHKKNPRNLPGVFCFHDLSDGNYSDRRKVPDRETRPPRQIDVILNLTVRVTILIHALMCCSATNCTLDLTRIYDK